MNTPPFGTKRQSKNEFYLQPLQKEVDHHLDPDCNIDDLYTNLQFFIVQYHAYQKYTRSPCVRDTSL